MTVLFAPHNDDETLFAFYQVLRFKPHVVVVFRSHVEGNLGGPSYAQREHETACAMAIADVGWEQWTFPDNAPDWAGISDKMLFAMINHDIVICPAVEDGGHEQHTGVGQIVEEYARSQLIRPRLIRYLTYRRGHGRSEYGLQIVPDPDEADLKKLALACYGSQAAYAPTAPWFGDDQREFVL